MKIPIVNLRDLSTPLGSGSSATRRSFEGDPEIFAMKILQDVEVAYDSLLFEIAYNLPIFSSSLRNF